MAHRGKKETDGLKNAKSNIFWGKRPKTLLRYCNREHFDLFNICWFGAVAREVALIASTESPTKETHKSNLKLIFQIQIIQIRKKMSFFKVCRQDKVETDMPQGWLTHRSSVNLSGVTLTSLKRGLSVWHNPLDLVKDGSAKQRWAWRELARSQPLHLPHTHGMCVKLGETCLSAKIWPAEVSLSKTLNP